MKLQLHDHFYSLLHFTLFTPSLTIIYKDIVLSICFKFPEYCLTNGHSMTITSFSPVTQPCSLLLTQSSHSLRSVPVKLLSVMFVAKFSILKMENIS